MIPIWHGDMTKVLDIWKFEAILENVHIWATRTLRPLLSTYVMQWKNRFIDKKAIHGASMSQVLETLKHNHVTERINLTQAIDYAAQRGFEMGRHHALTFDHQLILDSTRYACIEENNKFLTRLERTLDVKFQRDQELRDGLSMRKLENVLDETIRGSQNSVMSQLDMMNKKIDMLHLSRVSSGSNCANDVSNTMTGSGKDDEEQDLPLPISIVTQGSSHKLFIREAIREYVTAISSMDQAIPTESVEGTTFTTDAPAQSLSSPPAVRNVQTETFNIMNSSSASISMQTLPPTEEKSSENADRKTENQVAPLPNGTKWILTS